MTYLRIGVSKDEDISLFKTESVNDELNIMVEKELRLQGILKLDRLLYVSISTADLAWYYKQTQLCHPFKHPFIPKHLAFQFTQFTSLP